MVQRKAVTKAIATRYMLADRAGMQVILDELCAMTGLASGPSPQGVAVRAHAGGSCGLGDAARSPGMGWKSYPGGPLPTASTQTPRGRDQHVAADSSGLFVGAQRPSRPVRQEHY